LELFSKQKLTRKYNNNTCTKKQVGSDLIIQTFQKYLKENKRSGVTLCRVYLAAIVSGGVTAVAAANQRR
jgi:hypothetical protein